MRLIVLFTLIFLAGCEQDEFADLKTFMAQAGQEGQHALDPLPQLKPQEEFSFIPEGQLDPFRPRVVKSGQSGGALQPDVRRQKEYLEGFPLDALRMVGTIAQKGHLYALVKTPDGAVSRVTKGNYLGQNYGLIIGISDSAVELRETIQDGAGEWIESKASLALQE
ncbi:MAG: pilus assembly protein PilP [Thiobacillus sp.]|nr:pilus assembly protein PilP [Thiobacillus sp.]